MRGGYTALMGFGASESAAWSLPIDQALADPSLQSQIPASRLYAAALPALQQPDIKGQLSVFGALSVDVFTSAAQRAAQEVTGSATAATTIISAGKSIIEAVYAALPETTMGLLDTLGKSSVAGAAGAVAEAAPIIGAFVEYALAVLDWTAAQQAAQEAAAQKLCTKSYRPPKSTRSQFYGGMTPADLMHSSLGDVFAALESSIPERTAADCKANSSLKQFYSKIGLTCGMYIPAATRRVLRIMRLAIQNSWNDSTSDAGVSLWPAYIDLVHAQFRQKRIDNKWALYLFDQEAQPPYLGQFTLRPDLPDTSVPETQRSRLALHKIRPGRVARGTLEIPTEIPASGVIGKSGVMTNWIVSSGGCSRYEHRAFDEFREQMREWGLVVEPVYSMDKAKAEALKSEIAAIVREVAAGSLGKKPLQLVKMSSKQRSAQMRRMLAPIRSSALTALLPDSPFLAFTAGGLLASAGVYLYFRYGRRRAA